MEIQLVIALAIAIPVILFPAAYIWYFNLGGLLHFFRTARQQRAAASRLIARLFD